MRMQLGWISFGLGLLCFSIQSAHGISTLNISTGVNFQWPVLRTDLFDQYTLDAADPIILRPSLVSLPSLPQWLKFVQPDASSDGTLYGTPEETNVGDFNLEIVALNTKTYESSRILSSLYVQENPVSPAVLSNFFISNQNVADFLSTQVQEDFLSVVASLWGQRSGLVIQSLTSAKDLGLPVPLNPDPSQKFGLQVTVGSQQESGNLTTIISEATGPCQSSGAYTPAVNGLFLPNFVIDWCKVSTSRVKSAQPTSNMSAVFLGGEYNPPLLTVEDSDHFLEFVWLLVLPCAVILCLILILGYVMCCGRRGRKDIDNTPEMQLAHHRTLRQASRDLRTMSNRRDGTASVATLTPIGTPTVASQRPHNRSRGYDEYPWASTPQINHRGMATPPPYRTPPHPHKHRETTFSNHPSDKRRLSEPSNARGEDMAPIRPAPPFMGSSTSDRGVRPRHV
ncbi:epsilon-sarcoglycan-like [Diadema setosum]|uniref:epsilon-sarcoglycan-like n=1 Tax=Diadema setosum TaxID=31175 RepID=UPI003B3A8D4B